MRIYGSDFTSAPSKRKPITLTACDFTDGLLRVVDFESLTTFADFEAFLARDGAWIAGFDFPFGQPLTLIENMDFPRTWAGYVELIAAMGKREWVSTVQRYMQPRPMGDKLHFRVADRIAGAQSPMKMSFIPVGRMFFEGAPRLLASGVSIPANHPTASNRIALEVYPALVARKFVGRGSGYKSDNADKWTDEAQRKRQTIVDGLRDTCIDLYGFEVHLTDTLAHEFITDPTGDKLDAFLGAIQAAWASTQPNYGIPADINPLEGWIIDPDLLAKYQEVRHE